MHSKQMSRGESDPQIVDYVRETLLTLEPSFIHDRVFSSRRPRYYNHELTAIVDLLLDEMPPTVAEKRVLLAEQFGHPDPEKCKQELRKTQHRRLYLSVCYALDTEVTLR